MNFLFLSELFYPHGGGAELATYMYAKLLGENGHNVIVITNRFAGEPETAKGPNVTIYRLPMFERVDVLFCSLLSKLIKWAEMVYVPRFWYSAIPFEVPWRASHHACARLFATLRSSH
ncbi:MAG: hypothetical protein ABSD49_08795 [Candidatus Bathyarchaeia archaeon]|jgi:glycosyltransferase involved in cell wall biosynthesis